jgi:hypothetical protein
MSIKSFFSSILLVLSTVLFLESLKIISLPFKFTYQTAWGPYTSSISNTIRSTTILFLYDIARSPLGLLLPIGLIAFAIYRLVVSESKPVIEAIIIVGLASIILIMKFNLIGFRYIGQAFWPILILFSILILISSRNNNY